MSWEHYGTSWGLWVLAGFLLTLPLYYLSALTGLPIPTAWINPFLLSGGDLFGSLLVGYGVGLCTAGRRPDEVKHAELPRCASRATDQRGGPM